MTKAKTKSPKKSAQPKHAVVKSSAKIAPNGIDPFQIPIKLRNPLPDGLVKPQPETKPAESIKSDFKLEFPHPNVLIDERLQRVELMARETLANIYSEMLAIRTADIDIASFGFGLQELPLDVIQVVVSSIDRAGWRVHYNDENRWLNIELPEAKWLSGRQVVHAGPSVVKPL